MATKATSADMAVIAVETIAAAALRARLRSYGKVAVQVTASAWDLLAGRVGGAKVEGRLWESPLGLTARVLDVEVGLVELDLPAVFAQQRIMLRNTPVGAARVVFNAGDFGAFLQHPLVATAARTAVQGRPFIFDRAGIVIVPGSGAGAGCVLFSGLLPSTGQRYQLAMRPTCSGRAAAVAATPVGPAPNTPGRTGVTAPLRDQRQAASYTGAASGVAAMAPSAPGMGPVGSATEGSGEEDAMVSSELSRFFSGLLVDLQGAELAFSCMKICAGGGGTGLWRREPGASSPVDSRWGSSNSGGGGRGDGVRGRETNNRESIIAGGEVVLELELRATIRSFPPLNVQF